MAVPEATLDLVRKGMAGLKPPGPGDKVYKEECMFSFDTPEAAAGLYVNLRTYQAFGLDYVPLDVERTGNSLYLHQKWTRVPKAPPAGEAAAAPTKMAIGVEGGFSAGDDYDVVKESSLVVMPGGTTVPLPCADLPMVVTQVVDELQRREDATSLGEDKSHLAWEEERRVSKYAAALAQESTGKRIPPDPSAWRCEESGETENLWLNLSDGFIGSGRRQWDGSGGNGAALRHYEAMKAQGKEYPLVVKLGTITPAGADVFSYAPDEDDLVEDPKLAEHLVHWGIDAMSMEKTEKSMAELNIDMNQRFEWDKITEAGSELKALSGPGYVGLKNLGNSCYINSVVQVLKEVPELAARYAAPAEGLFRSSPAEPQGDFACQMAKLWTGLLTARYADVAQPEGVEQEGATSAPCVQPRMFKALVGKGHPEFSTSQQQDAVEYFQHLVEYMARAERAAGARLEGATPSSGLFAYKTEERVQCVGSGRVSYRTSQENVLSLFIPVEAASNKTELDAYREREQKRQKLRQEGASAYIGAGGPAAEPAAAVDAADEEPVRPVVPFSACLSRLAAAEGVEDFYSAALGRKGPASKTWRMATFPKYLAVQMRRFYVGENWTAKKLDVLVDVPEALDIEHLRGTGLQPGEEEQPAEAEGAGAAAAAAAAAPARPEPSAEIVSAIMAMGFSECGARRAAVATNNAGVEASMEWVFAHMEDADFNDPMPEPGADGPAAGGGGGAPEGAPPEAVAMLCDMGFQQEHAEAALRACSNSVERAADWLFSHMDDLAGAVAEVMGAAAAEAAGGGDGGESAAPAAMDDGPGRYELVGFVSHMGSNTSCGHYVCHVKREGRWVIYNDRKVAESSSPPLGLGYLYFYRRV